MKIGARAFRFWMFEVPAMSAIVAACTATGLFAASRGHARPQTAQTQETAPVGQAVVDPALEGAERLIGRAMFLRGCYAGDNLAYDASGHVKGEPKAVDWTLAGANIDKVERRGTGVGAGELELDGERVATRYNPEQHLFERHILKDRKLKITLDVNEARGLQGVLATIFAYGIDPALQRSMPAYWRHYFSPAMPWPSDDLTGKTVIPATAAATGGLEMPVLERKSEPEFTNEARADRVRGTVVVRLTVGPDGVPRRLAIKQPLGYGLDARVVETVERYRFHPGTKDGTPIAVEMLVNQAFDSYPPPSIR